MTACINDVLTLRSATSTFDRINQVSTYQGRVDICVNGTYIPICDLGWDNVDAQVACSRMFGSDFSKCTTILY